jgi:hypothetical protein
MRVTYLRVFLALALALAGWSVGRAQTTVAEFEIRIGAVDPGAINVYCFRGCNWSEALNSQNGGVTLYRCGSDADRCSLIVSGQGIEPWSSRPPASQTR